MLVVEIVVVIMIVPIAIGVPAVSIFIPPTMPLAPAAFAGFPQIAPGMLGLLAVGAVMLDGFVQIVVGLDDAPLTAVVVVGQGRWCGSECQQANKCRGG